MFRRVLPRLVGTIDDVVFSSVIKDKNFLDKQIATIGKMEAAGKFEPSKLSQEDLNRFTTSGQSAENYFNKRQGTVPKGLVVDEKTGMVEGSARLDPTRYGDWEVDGRCYDF